MGEVLVLGLGSAPDGGGDGPDLGAGDEEGWPVVLDVLPESLEGLPLPDAAGFMGFIFG